GGDGGRSGLTRTKLKYVTRAGMEERKEEGGLTDPKRLEEHQNAVGNGECCRIFFAAGIKIGWSLARQKLADGTVIEIEAGVSAFIH
ncbi:hypothetical protein TNCV_686001, partial [Trichonephila clavipes]